MNIQQTTLPSGLTVVSARLPEFGTAAVTAVVRAGSRDEAAEQSGVAHFLEHMAFKGTGTRSAFDIAVEIECLGASINAFTSHEVTAYHVNGLRRSVEDAVAILGDVLTASRFAENDVALERSVIGQEIARNGDDPGALCSQGLMATAYAGQTLGRPILGDPAVVAGMEREKLLAFVGRHYCAGNMVVTAAGDVAHDALVGLVQRHFAALPMGERPTAGPAPRYGGGLHRTQREDFKQVNVALGFPSVPVGAPECSAHRMLGVALGGGMSSPLFQEVRQKRGLVYGVGAGSNNGTDFGLLGIQAGTTPDKLADCLRVICAEARRITEAVGPRDFERAHNALLTELTAMRERPFSLAFYMAGQFFRDRRVTGPQRDLDLVAAVSIGDVRDAARQVLDGPPTLSLVGPVAEADPMAIVTEGLARQAA